MSALLPQPGGFKYQREAKHREKLSGVYLEAFDAALDWAAMGSEAPPEGSSAPEARSGVEEGFSTAKP